MSVSLSFPLRVSVSIFIEFHFRCYIEPDVESLPRLSPIVGTDASDNCPFANKVNSWGTNYCFKWEHFELLSYSVQRLTFWSRVKPRSTEAKPDVTISTTQRSFLGMAVKKYSIVLKQTLQQSSGEIDLWFPDYWSSVETSAAFKQRQTKGGMKQKINHRAFPRVDNRHSLSTETYR